MKNVYFAGKAGAGKTYACRYLIKKYGYRQAKFAYPVYNLAYNYFDMKDKDRKLLQIIGTDVGRTLVDSEIWVNRFIQDTFIVQETAKKLGLSFKGFVSDDVRFPNEHKALKNAGWIGLFLTVPDDIRIKRLGKRDGDAQVATLQHSSETSIDIFKDELIQVDSSESLEATYKNIDKALAEYSAGK